MVGDVHLSDRPPSIRTESYREDILAKLRYTVEVADRHEVDVVVWAGDVFHVKAPTRTSHGLVQEVADIGQSYQCDWVIVPGNHDMRHDRLDSLDEQPLGVLFKAGAYMGVGELEGETWKLFCIPWLYDWRIDLPVYMERWANDDAPLMVTHAPIVKPGEDRPFEVIDATDWAHLMGRGGDVYYGHMHDPDGGYHAAPDGANHPFIFCNNGAISRGSIHEATLKREPAVTVYSDLPEEITFFRVPVPHRPAAEVFRLNEKEREDVKQERLDEFLGSLAETKLTAMSIEAVVAHLDTLELSEPTRREVIECLESVM
jgi:hypothetical protein